MNFEVVFERVIGSEGAFTSDPRDRGNWTGGKVGLGSLKGTKYGISAMTYPTIDIANLTLDQARDIYRVEWWDRFDFDRYRDALAYQMFDAAINNGIGRANQMLQRALGVDDDGVIGEITMKAYRSCNRHDIVLRFLAERIEYFANAKSWISYSEGWMRRVAKNLRYAAEDN